MGQGQSRVNLDETYSQRLVDLQTWSQQAAELAPRGLPVPWWRPQDWPGDLTNLPGFREPFDRQAINQAGMDAIKDSKNPGTTGDVVAASLQIETLACLERAMKVRHTYRRARCVHLAAGRWRGHGQPMGVWYIAGRGYVHAILQGAAKSD